ncbi:MAG: HEAT repeat domain-containing protein [Acidobacteriota bacterium]|nr:HEAT repeat domain-containing protein [Acidobacteriota bacterium]
MAQPPAPAPEPLGPENGSRLADFARACKAATRIVSLYPESHPAIQSALLRIAETAKQAVANGPFPITVLPDALLVGGRGLAKPDPAATELAALLHQQLIGEMTLVNTMEGHEWHAFLSLLAKTPEDARAMGGVAKAWVASGNKSITLTEIDYAEVLRERAGSGESASWDRIMATLNEAHGQDGGGEQAPMASMLALADDPEKLAQFAEKLQAAGRASGDDSIQQRKTLLELMHGLANYAADRKPDEFDAVLNNMAGAAARMSPDMLLSLMTDPPPLASGGGGGTKRMDLAGELQSRLTDEMVSKFLIDNVVKDHGATGRLAAAFQTLVPDADRQQSILAAAAEQAQAMFGEDPAFESVWTSSTEILMSYSDSKFVSDDYARELTSARSQPVDVEKSGDDPPARIRAWVATVGDDEIRALDQRLLLDLLTIETRPDVWAGMLDVAITSIDQLVLVGDLKLAAQLVENIVVVSRNESSPFAPSAAAGITRLVEGSLARHLAHFLRQASDAEVALANKICKTIGPALVEPLADALAAEDNARTVRRLRDILIGFGPAARRYADELRRSANPAVRRAAVDLLRALGGEGALPDLRGLLDDADPAVQREALRAIVQIGTNEAYHVLENALETGKQHTRDAVLQALGALRDERAAPLFVYILNHTGHTGQLEALYVSAIESLGRVAVDERSVSTLKDILERGEWYAPNRTARIRAAAARALRAMGSSSTERVLSEAAASGSGGVKRAAKAALAEPAPIRSAIRRVQ